MKQASIIPLLKFKEGSLPLNIQTIQDFMTRSEDTHEAAHRHNYYEMIWLTKGAGTLYADLQEYPIGRNTIFYLKPNEAHQFRVQQGMEGFVFSFSEAFFRLGEYDFDLPCQAGLYQLFNERRTINISNDLEVDMQETALKMIKESENKHAYQIEVLKRYFKILLLYLMRTLEEGLTVTERTRETELVQHFLKLLEQHYKEKKMVAEYAGQLLVTPNHLNRIVKKITGASAGHHIRQRVVLEAKRMGRYSDAGMKEIAYSLGFLDSAHFSRFFKSFGGLNFSDFKRSGMTIPIGTSLNRA